MWLFAYEPVRHYLSLCLLWSRYIYTNVQSLAVIFCVNTHTHTCTFTAHGYTEQHNSALSSVSKVVCEVFMLSPTKRWIIHIFHCPFICLVLCLRIPPFTYRHVISTRREESAQMRLEASAQILNMIIVKEPERKREKSQFVFTENVM